jgi:hypothetical protein
MKRILSVFVLCVVLVMICVSGVNVKAAENVSKDTMNIDNVNVTNMVDKIMYCDKVELHKSIVIEGYEIENIYECSLLDENGNKYIMYADNDVSNRWFMCVVDSMGTDSVEDDRIMDIVDLDEYMSMYDKIEIE